jgi:hypothetical protein
MDSTKLNRGILIIRYQLNLEEKDFTSRTIFESTTNMILKVNSTLNGIVELKQGGNNK